MKQKIITILIIFTTGLISCRKDKNELTIKQYDQQQIQNYISVHGLTGFQRDTTGGDTTGIYYKILNPGSGQALDYPDEISFVFTLTTLDGTYISSDTIANHFHDFVGHINGDGYPLGLQTAIHNILKYPGASMRVIIPSHLAFGINGSGSGSSQVSNNRIKGNESLDYYIHAIGNFPAYDDMCIQNYMKAQNLSGYTKTADGLYYQILTPATTLDDITDNSTITATYTGQLLNLVIFDQVYNGTTPFTGPIVNFVPGVKEGLENYASIGTKISLLVPSYLGFGVTSQVGIPSFSCLRFTYQLTAVTP